MWGGRGGGRGGEEGGVLFFFPRFLGFFFFSFFFNPPPVKGGIFWGVELVEIWVGFFFGGGSEWGRWGYFGEGSRLVLTHTHTHPRPPPSFNPPPPSGSGGETLRPTEPPLQPPVDALLLGWSPPPFSSHPPPSRHPPPHPQFGVIPSWTHQRSHFFQWRGPQERGDPPILGAVAPQPPPSPPHRPPRLYAGFGGC